VTTVDQTAPGVTDRDHVAGAQLPVVTDEFMQERLAKTKTYTVAMLKKTPKYKRPDVDPIIWEHGRRNFALGEHGVLPIVLPVIDESEWAGVGLFDATPDETSQILDSDPAVEAGILTYEVHAVVGFPGSTLPS
jgi:hypothetical protein